MAVTSGFLTRLSAERSSLTVKFTLLVVALITALMAVLIVLHNLDVRRANREIAEQRIDLLVSGIKDVAAREADMATLDTKIRRLIGLFDFKRHLDAYSFSTGAPRDGERSLSSVIHREAGTLHIAIPLMAAQGQTAHVSFDVDMDAVTAEMSPNTARNAIFILASFLIIGPLMVFFMRQVTTPVRMLIDCMGSADDKQVDLSETSCRQDEIGSLSRAFESMKTRIALSADSERRLSTTDAVTGLPNSNVLAERLEQLLARGSTFALYIVDIDRLGQINLDLGSDTGDRVLKAAGIRLLEAVTAFQPMVSRPEGAVAEPGERFLARFGSDDFAVLVHGAEIGEEAAEIAAELLLAFRRPLDIDGRPVPVVVSVGIALAPADGGTSAELKRNAHLALHEAKSHGRGSFRFARSDLAARADKRRKIEHELRLGLERDELIVYYQPQVDLRDGAFIGAEALVRWQHPERGIVGPMDFIDIAEDAGLIDQIGSFVLDSVSRQISSWARQGLFPKVSVNVSASQCMQPDFCSSVFEMLSRCGAPTTSLQIELTETVAMRDPARTARELAPLRAAGIRMAIDDFGTGYSNLATITRLPFDILKIDRSFVSECARDGASRVIVATILNMAQNLGYHTVAEGVETEVQREFLLRYGCTYAQGYLFGKPMPAQDFEEAYREKRREEARELQDRVSSIG